MIFARDFAKDTDQDRTLFIHKMILQLGIDSEIGWIQWFEKLIPQLKNFNESQN